MAKIVVTGVSYDQSNYTILVTLSEPHEVDGEAVYIPLGEAALRFPSDTEMEDVKKLIVDKAEDIWHAHVNAVDKRHDIDELVLPDIP